MFFHFHIPRKTILSFPYTEENHSFISICRGKPLHPSDNGSGEGGLNPLPVPDPTPKSLICPSTRTNTQYHISSVRVHYQQFPGLYSLNCTLIISFFTVFVVFYVWRKWLHSPGMEMVERGGDNLGSHRSRDPSPRPELTDDPWPEKLFVVKSLLS